MPAWSPEIANEFIRLAAADGHSFDQMKLQILVYIAHGWCLAIHDEPLTGDRPEAWSFGPVYRRLADALVGSGVESVAREIRNGEAGQRWQGISSDSPARADLEEFERKVIKVVYENYGSIDYSKLVAFPQQEGTPWAEIYADGGGEYRDIPHNLIKAQFVALVRR